MNFSDYGDTHGNLLLATSCADALKTGLSLFAQGCGNGVRPFGATLYFALPKLVARDDLILFNHLVLAQNLFVFAFGIWFSLRISRRLAGELWLAYLLPAFLVVNLVGHLPYRLPDLPALVLLLAVADRATAIGPDEPGNIGSWVTTGVLTGALATVRQPYLIYGLAIIIFSSFALNSWRVRCLRVAAAICASAVPVLILFTVNFYSFGQFYFYDRDEVAKFRKGGFSFPNVTLIAHNSPPASAFMITVPLDQNRLGYYSLKLSYGIWRYHFSPYLGIPDARDWERTLHPKHVRAEQILIALATLILLIAGTLVGPFAMRTLAFGGLANLLFILLQTHTEWRYFLFTRFSMAAIGLCVLVRARHFLKRERVTDFNRTATVAVT